MGKWKKFITFEVLIRFLIGWGTALTLPSFTNISKNLKISSSKPPDKFSDQYPIKKFTSPSFAASWEISHLSFLREIIGCFILKSYSKPIWKSSPFSISSNKANNDLIGEKYTQFFWKSSSSFILPSSFIKRPPLSKLIGDFSTLINSTWG